MKKAILLIAALLLVGSLAFAEVSIGIWGRTVFYLAKANANDTNIYQAWGPNWGGEGPRMGLNFTFTGEKIDYKITAYINGAPKEGDLKIATPINDNNTPADPSDDYIDDLGNIEMVNMYGTLKFVPDLLSVYVGRMDGDGFDTFRKTSPNPNSDVNNDNIGRLNGWGIIVAVSPKDSGFDAALQIKTGTPDDSADINITNTLYNINVAASYAIANIVKISAGFVNTSVYDATAVTNYNIFARLELLAVENLTLWVDGRIFGLEVTNGMQMKFVLGAGYKMDALGLALGAKLAIPASGSNYVDFGANLEGYYDLGDLTLGIILGLSDSNTSVDGMVIDVKPYVQLDDFGTRIAFELSYNTAAGAGLSWAVPVYFTFSF